MNRTLSAILTSTPLVLTGVSATYVQNARANITLIQSVNIFDGQNEKLATSRSVLVEGDKIAGSITASVGAEFIH